MKKSLFLFAMFLAANAYSQVEINWKTPIEGKPKSINFHSFTQTPVVETSTYYYGVNSIDQTIVWTIKKSPKMAALQAVRTASALTGANDATQGFDLTEYSEIPYTQFASICNNLIDVSTGKILLGEETNPFKSLLSTNIISELNLLLAKVKDDDGSQKLYAIDLATSQIVWSTRLAEPNGGKDVMKFLSAGNPQAQDLFVPSVTATGDIIYNNDGKLDLINGKTGAIAWENNCDPGTFFVNQDQTKIIVVAKPSGAMSMMSAPKPFGKTVIGIDAATGKNLWKEPAKLDGTYKMYSFLSDTTVLLANQDGLNLYSVNTGKNLWKDDFEARNLKSMEVKAEGLELQYGNKIIVIDTKTGKKVWKKALVLEDLDENAEYEPFKKDYQNTSIVLTPSDLYAFDKTTGKKKWSRGFDNNARVAFDDANGKILIISSKKIYLFNVDEQIKAPKPIDVKIANPQDIAGYQISELGYFIFGQKEFLFLDKEGKLLDQKEYAQLSGGGLKKAGLLTATIAGSVLGAHAKVSVNGGPSQDVGVFVDPATAKKFEAAARAQNELLKKIRTNDKQRRAVRSDNSFAYFLKGEKTKDGAVISLVLVDKKTGKEVKTIDFSKNREVIYEIDFNNGMLYFMDNGQFNMIKI
jgi:outer membrane protein assembly factor BamB